MAREHRQHRRTLRCQQILPGMHAPGLAAWGVAPAVGVHLLSLDRQGVHQAQGFAWLQRPGGIAGKPRWNGRRQHHIRHRRRRRDNRRPWWQEMFLNGIKGSGMGTHQPGRAQGQQNQQHTPNHQDSGSKAAAVVTGPNKSTSGSPSSP